MAKKKHLSGIRVLMYLLIVLLVLTAIAAGGAFFYLKHMLDGMNRVTMTSDKEELGITEDNETSTEVINIALFGVDTRDFSEDSGRSDSMIVLTIDKKNNKIKLTSLARDTRVYVEGHGYEKLAHAYAYGGAQLAIRTINSSFGLDIQDYVTVNFAQLADIIDTIGGVVVNVDQDEADVMNTNYIENEADRVTELGDIRLNGAQAVAYSRNRYTGSDVDRQARQREVLMALYHETLQKSVLEYPAILEKVLGMCETTLSSDRIMELGMWAVLGHPQLDQFALPSAGCDAYGGIMEDGAWYFVYDLDVATDILHQYLYEDIKPQE